MSHRESGPPARPSESSASDAGAATAVGVTVRGATLALLVLFSMNLLNYVDRYVLAAVGKSIMEDLGIAPGPFGWLGSAFIIVYTIVSPIVGWMGDRYSRTRLLAFGVGLWSIATVGTAFASSFNQMFVARALLGVGEASYGVVAPTLLADLFEPRKRGRMMGIFYLALPVGTAIGYAVGGLMQKFATEHAAAIQTWATGVGLGALAPYLIKWRAAFWVVGLPGLVLAFCGLLIREPARGASEGLSQAASEADRPGLPEYLGLLKIPSYLLNTAGMAAVTFTIGAYGHWMPAYFQYVHRTPPEDNLQIGVALAVAGLLGILLGMWLPDRIGQTTRRAYQLWPAIAVLAAVPFGAAGLLAPAKWVALSLLFVASVLLTSCLGPCNTVTANVVPSNRRAVGYALSIFLLHLFGDIPSPPLIGSLATELARPEVRASAVGRFFESVGARVIDPAEIAGHAEWEQRTPSAHEDLGPNNITAGMLVIIPILLIGSLCFFLGARFLPRDMDNARRTGGGTDDGAVHFH